MNNNKNNNRQIQIQLLKNKQKAGALSATGMQQLTNLLAKTKLGGKAGRRQVIIRNPVVSQRGGPQYTVRPRNTGQQLLPSGAVVGNEISPDNYGLPAGVTPGMVKMNLGSTKDGRNWALACLDPCGEIASDVVGIPDTSTAPVATPTYRGEYEIVFDKTLFNTAPTSPTTFSVQIVIPPIPEIELMYRIRDDNSGQWSRVQVLRTPGYQLTASEPTVPAHGPTLRTIGYSKSRIVSKGINIELNAAAIANQGRIVSGQIDGNLTCFDHDTSAVGAAGAPPVATALRGLGASSRIIAYVVPDSPQYLVSVSPDCYQCEAKDGCYVPLHFDGPLQGYEFKQTNGGNSRSEATLAPNASGTEIAVTAVVPSSLLALRFSDAPVENAIATAGQAQFAAESYYNNYPLSYNNSDNIHRNMAGIQNGEEYTPAVSDPSDMLTSVTFFSGLVVGGGGSATASGATLRLKTRMTFEGISYGSPSIAPFVHPPAMYDDDAIQKVVKLMQMQPPAYPSRYNGWGDVFGKIWTGIKNIGRPLLAAAEFIPGIGTAAKYARAGIDLADSMLDNYVPF